MVMTRERRRAPDGGESVPGTTAPASDGAGRHVDPDALTEDAVAVVARWLTEAHSSETPAERRSTDRMRAIIADPGGIGFTMRFVDRVARHRQDVLAAEQLVRLVTDRDLPGFLGPMDRLMLQAGARLAPALPRLVMSLARRRLRQLVGHMVVDAAPGSMHDHLSRRRADGYAMNVNLLGEAVLGEGEASRRFERTLELIRDPAVDYVSVKVSAIASQLNMWAFDHTLERVKDRLRVLYRAAAAAPTEAGRTTFVNLDMEEHRDLEVTLRAFMELLDEPDLRDLDAGIVLQAYLPDAFGALQRITAWACARSSAGGGEVKVRLVKGANLAMERVDASMHGWVQAPYGTKAEVDANYKRCVDWALRPIHARSVRIGLASHNLFDVAWAHLLAEARGVADRVEFEMLQGMAPSQARGSGPRPGACSSIRRSWDATTSTSPSATSSAGWRRTVPRRTSYTTCSPCGRALRTSRSRPGASVQRWPAVGRWVTCPAGRSRCRPGVVDGSGTSPTEIRRFRSPAAGWTCWWQGRSSRYGPR